MELEELKKLVTTDFRKLKEQIVASRPPFNYGDIKKEYDPKLHSIHDKAIRPDKLVETDDGTTLEPVTRLSIPVQKKIVGLAAAFLCGNAIQLKSDPVSQVEKDLVLLVQKIWDDNKLDYDSMELAEIMMSETEVAELWYNEAADPIYWKDTPNEKITTEFEGKKVAVRLRMKILANSKGDSLYPVFNKVGDMVAFARSYNLKEADIVNEYIEIYTNDNIYLATKRNSDTEWTVTTKDNLVRKIPVIYYSQPTTEWSDVQEMIGRKELLISNHGDSNDYFGSPMVFVEGDVEGFAKKGERGKVLIGKNGAKASYLTWDQAPESIKLEYNNLRSLIFDMTDTPDISIEQMKSLGTYSGIALKMLFMGAHLKASRKEGIFGKSIQRRINYIKSALAKLNMALEPALPLSIKPKFEYYLPKDDKETVDILTTATGGGSIMSKKTAVKRNPLVEDADAELETMKEESESTGALDENL